MTKLWTILKALGYALSWVWMPRDYPEANVYTDSKPNTFNGDKNEHQA